MTLTAGCVVQANDTYTKVIDLYECPPLFIYHNLTLGVCNAEAERRMEGRRADEEREEVRCESNVWVAQKNKNKGERESGKQVGRVESGTPKAQHPLSTLQSHDSFAAPVISPSFPLLYGNGCELCTVDTVLNKADNSNNTE